MTVDERLDAAFGALHGGRWDDAIARFAVAQQLHPDHPAARTGFAEALIASGRLVEAQDVLTAIAPMFPGNPWPELLLGRIAAGAGQAAQARERALRAVALGDAEPGVHFAAAAIARASGESALADRLLDDGRMRFPDDEPLACAAAERAAERGAWQQAQELWHAVLARAPHSSEALRGCALAREAAPPADRQVVIVYGNCQVKHLCLLLRHVPALAERFDFVAVTNHGLGSRPIPPVPEHATRAVLVLEQYAHLARVDVREAMYQSLRSEHRVIRFPSLVLMTLWPFACVDRRPRANPSERYPWGDSVAIEVASMGLPRAEIFQRYMDVSAAKMPDLDKLLTYDREVMKRCEKVCDVNMADVIFARMRTQHLFWTWRYVSGILMRELILRLVEHGQDVFGDLDATSEMHVNTACMMEQAQTDAQFPIHPLVAERLGLTYIDAAVTYRWFGHRWTFEEYMTRYIALDPEW